MFENPGDELYFGEVYRQILQEAWLPGGGDVWSVVGKSRRGRRPTQKGITGPHVSPSQTEVRRWFSKCSSSWRVLPYEIYPGAFCDNRQGKKYWYEEKERRGLMCSAYDLYMRYCLRFALDTGCIPPANYLLTVEGDLSSISCNKSYDLNFPNKCGDVSFVSGEGEFIPPGEWLSPMFGTKGQLCFQDANNSLGFISFVFDPYVTILEWDPANPDEVPADGSVSISVLGGSPPFTWSVLGTGFWFDAEYSITTKVTSSRSVILYADNSACGSAHITISDYCSQEVLSHVRSTAGQWVLKLSDVCVLSGEGELTEDHGTWWVYELISGHKKQQQNVSIHIQGGMTCEYLETHLPGSWQECIDPAGTGHCVNCSTPCVNCIAVSPHDVLCECVESGPPPYFICYCNSRMYYYEWEC